MELSKNSTKIFLAILLIYTLYAGLYIYRTSFLVDGERYFVLFDDAMISMRYAKHLAEGYGPTWNIGETPVEGYTNPLWMAFMSIFHLFPIPASKISLFIQISGALFLGANLFFVKKIGEFLSTNATVPILAVILTAFYIPLNNWGLQGMEVSALVLVLNAAIWLILRDRGKENFSFIPYLLLGIGTLIRLDMALPYMIILGYQVFSYPKERQKNLLWGIGIFIVIMGSQTLFRYIYYGDILPNTYYLKVSGFPIHLRIARGFYVLFAFIQDFNWILFFLPLVILAYRRDHPVLLLLTLIISQVAYSVYVGGDAWEHKGGSNRYISIIMPIFFILFAFICNKIITAIGAHTRSSPKLHPRTANIGLILFVTASMVNFNSIYNTTQRNFETWFLVRQPVFIQSNLEYLDIVQAIKKISTPDARIAVVSAGTIPYFTERFSIDLLGKNDPYIAHLPSRIPDKIEDIRPGHMKWDYDYSIGQLEPDLVIQLWGDKKEAKEVLSKYYVTIEVDGLLLTARHKSEKILWDRVQIMP